MDILNWLKSNIKKIIYLIATIIIGVFTYKYKRISKDNEDLTNEIKEKDYESKSINQAYKDKTETIERIKDARVNSEFDPYKFDKSRMHHKD